LNQWQEKGSATCTTCLDYIIKSFSTTTGQGVVENLTGTKTTTGDLKPQTVLELKIVTKSVFSRSTTASVADNFYLKMRQSPCVDNLLTFSPTPASQYVNTYGTDSPVKNYSYQIGSAA